MSKPPPLDTGTPSPPALDDASSKAGTPAQQGAPEPFNEAQRLASLQRYRVLDTDPEQAYDDLTTLASAVCRAPIAYGPAAAAP